MVKRSHTIPLNKLKYLTKLYDDCFEYKKEEEPKLMSHEVNG